MNLCCWDKRDARAYQCELSCLTGIQSSTFNTFTKIHDQKPLFPEDMIPKGPTEVELAASTVF